MTIQPGIIGVNVGVSSHCVAAVTHYSSVHHALQLGTSLALSTYLITFAQLPRHNAQKPSSLGMRVKASMAPLYLQWLCGMCSGNYQSPQPIIMPDRPELNSMRSRDVTRETRQPSARCRACNSLFFHRNLGSVRVLHLQYQFYAFQRSHHRFFNGAGSTCTSSGE